MAKTQENLFDMFPPVSTEEWMAKITADLKGADFQKKLVWRTNEGFNVQPFYRREDLENLPSLNTLPGEFPYLRGTRDNNDWLIRQEVIGDTPEAQNAHIAHLLSHGVESLGIKLCGKTEPAALRLILAGVDLAKVEVNVSCCPGHAVEVAGVLVELIAAAGAENSFRGCIEFDPFKRLLKRGLEFPKDLVATALEVYNTVKGVPGMRCFAVDSFMLNNSGAYITQELGYALAWGAEWDPYDRGRPHCRRSGRPYQIQYGYLFQLLHGAG